MLHRIAFLLVLPAFCMIFVAATSMVSEGNAHCQMTMKFGGTLSGDPGPSWVPHSEACLEESCPTSGACSVTSQDHPNGPNSEYRECLCPSGGGGAGCRMRSEYHRAQPTSAWELDTSKPVVCVGEEECADEAPVCDWLDLGPDGNDPTKHRARCKCQP